MAETTWQGTSPDWEASANWSNGIPGTDAADLIAVFDGTSQVSPQENLDQSASTHRFQIVTTRDYLAGIASLGNPLKMQGITDGRAATLRNIQGDVHLWVAVGTSDIAIDTGQAAVYLDGTIQGIMVRSGQVTILSTGTLGDIGLVKGTNAKLTIEAAAVAQTPPSWLKLDGGTILNKRDFPVGSGQAIIANAGEWTQEGLITTGVFISVGGATLIYDPTGDPSAQAPNLIGTAGIFDASRYPGTIPMGRVLRAGATFYGTISEGVPQWADYDFDDPYFYP